ncbi:hypothetical protein AB6A40_008230 [Gnathostoma spinigerum]|uniref:Alpha-(1,6)-fucosyltransferase N- and catalytic domain-containing protein n=1 Tax=Gnathostoma spinigerum TaxID=75299 RepID=A0ABD6EVM4_9BILA
MRRLVLLALLSWMCILLYLSMWLLSAQHIEPESRGVFISTRHSRIPKEMENLGEQNAQLKRIIQTSGLQNKEKHNQSDGKKEMIHGTWTGTLSGFHGYSQEHETQRRHLHNSIKELYYYLLAQFESNKHLPFAQHATDQLLSLMGRSVAFADVTSADQWRSNELRLISEELTKKLDSMQNPSDCKSAR